MKRYVERSFGKKGSKVVITVFFVLLIALSTAGALFVFYGDFDSQSQVSVSAWNIDYSTFVFTLKEKQIKMTQYETKPVTVDYDREEAKDTIKWTSSDPRVAHIDPDGNIVALKAGKATITAQAGYYSSKCSVTVKAAPEKKVKRNFSTAFTANKVTLEKNKNSNDAELPYYIKVNRQKNCVTVYTYDEDKKYTVPVRAMVCSCGEDNGTPAGSFTISVKNRWHTLFGDVFGQYVTEFNGSILFHSVPYTTIEDPSTVEVSEYNGLGKSISMGCVRLAAADAKWIYDNCDAGTGVTVYDDEEDGPLGTPPAIKISSKKETDWDPTDDDTNNPYYDKEPKLTGMERLVLDKGDYFDPLNKVTAADSAGNDITGRISVEGKVNTDKTGEFIVKYSVTDDLNRSVFKYRYIEIK